VFTAAQPGQWGDGHINCQPKSYWQDLFGEFGWYPNDSLETAIAEEIRKNPQIRSSLPWMARNLMIFTPYSTD
jgi:hypothetical protein